jgi:integrase
LHWPQISETEVRLIRGKQRDKQVVEVVTISPALTVLLTRLRSLAKNDRLGAVFPNRDGNCYTEAGFKAMWSKLVLKALEEKAIEKRFTFHDLRSYHVTQHKIQRGALPDLHANPGTTARIYDRSKEVKRQSL